MSKKAISSYRTIMKGTALFGGVQVFTILINLVRGKLIALLLGPEGMGISSLLNSSTTMVQQFSSLGINLSAMKEISSVKEKGEKEEMLFIISIFRKLVFCTSLLGCLCCIVFAKQLSLFSFGTIAYQWHFIALSIMVFFSTMSSGELTILQSVRKLKSLAFSSIIGSSLGLLIGIPLFYYYRYNGIVPAMISLSLMSYAFNRYFARAESSFQKIPWRGIFKKGKIMVVLGLVLMISSLLGTISNYLLNAFIGNFGSFNDVGLYQAANSITNQYVGLIFAAMAADYFPRLVGVANDTVKLCETVNNQSEVIILIVAPLALLLILTAPLLIKILLTEDFISLISVIRWMGIGVFFKAILFPIGYISFSKGDKKFFFWFEGVYSNLMTLFLNILCYSCWGIVGIGVSFVISYALAFLLYVIIAKKRYQFQYTRSFVKLLVPLLLFVCISFAFSFIKDIFLSYLFMSFSFVFCTLFCLYQLNVRLNLIKISFKK